MSQASQSQAQPQSNEATSNEATSNEASRAAARHRRASRIPGQELTLNETLRVMDVAREMRDQRETAEEMFVRDDLRAKLRDKLVRTARLSGESVTEAEIDAAITQYFESLHQYNEPAGGIKRFLAHCWIWRGRIVAGAAALATVAGSFWFLFS